MILGLKLILVALIGYLLGSINTSILVGRFYGIDVRNYGSGNAGATNTLRILGKKAAILVSVGDMLKGIISALIGLWIINDIEGIGQLGVMAGGAAAIIGHNWPLYFKFKGGKGILTTFSVALMMDWRIALVLMGIFIIVVAITRYVALGSIIGCALFPVISIIPVFDKSFVFTLFALIVGLLGITRHHANIKRILEGIEPKLGGRGVG